MQDRFYFGYICEHQIVLTIIRDSSKWISALILPIYFMDFDVWTVKNVNVCVETKYF